jgi:hypothetical protein
MDSIYNKNGSLHVVMHIKRFCICDVEPASLSPAHGDAARTATCFLERLDELQQLSRLSVISAKKM